MSARSERSERVRKQLLTEHIKHYVLGAEIVTRSRRRFTPSSRTISHGYPMSPLR